MFNQEKHMNEIRVGSWVGASRWPNRAAHPDKWGRPIGGQVLDVMSTCVWAHTLEFPVPQPDGGLVMAHVMSLRKQGKLDGVVPVLWDYGDHRQIRWERVDGLRQFSDDIRLWRASKAMRRDELDHPQRKPRPLSDFLPQTYRHLAPA